jgi:hypothetical protein
MSFDREVVEPKAFFKVFWPKVNFTIYRKNYTFLKKYGPTFIQKIFRRSAVRSNSVPVKCPIGQMVFGQMEKIGDFGKMNQHPIGKNFINYKRSVSQ